MNIRATSTFRPGNLARIEERIVPRLIGALQIAGAAVAEQARDLAPERTGELRDSIGSTTAWEGQRVTASIEATAPHAAYVEFGTGIRGASSEGAGPGPYNPEWPGMVAQPYLRPAIDGAHDAIIAALEDQGFRS